MSRPYAEVIGDPISHSKSPLIHNFWLGKLGIDAEYRACHVRPEELADYFAERRADPDWRGCNVTIPHKEKVIALVDELDSKATKVRAVNAVIRRTDGSLLGTNTDVDGIADAVARLDLKGRHAVVLGSGGAARAAFAYLADKHCASVRIVARDAAKAARAAIECGLSASDVRPFTAEGAKAALADANLLINATQLGMTGQQPLQSFVLDHLSDMHESRSTGAHAGADALVFDMVYSPLETELLAAAHRQHIDTATGLDMLVGQAASAFDQLFGQPPPHRCNAELRMLLTS